MVPVTFVLYVVLSMLFVSLLLGEPLDAVFQATR